MIEGNFELQKPCDTSLVTIDIPTLQVPWSRLVVLVRVFDALNLAGRHASQSYQFYLVETHKLGPLA